MLRLVLARLAVGLLTLLAVSLVVFLGTEALPGDAATATLGRDATPASVAQLQREFGLDRPVHERYREWLGGMLGGDLGKSLPSGDSVWQIISEPVRNTAILVGVTIMVLAPLGVLFGVLAAVRRDRALDHTLSGVSLTLISLPEFVVGSLLVLAFSVWVTWLPPISLIDPSLPLVDQRSVLVLPVATLIAASVAQTMRMVRACMIDVLRSDYVEMARLKGARPGRVLMRHALPNALGPTLQVLAINVAWLTGGVVVVEAVFQYNGLGLALTGAVSSRDLPTVQAVALLVGAVYVIVNLLADIGTMLLNPRLRRGQA